MSVVHGLPKYERTCACVHREFLSVQDCWPVYGYVNGIPACVLLGVSVLWATVCKLHLICMVCMCIGDVYNVSI